LRDFRNQVRENSGVEKKHSEREGGHQYRRLREGPHRKKFQHFTPLSTNRAWILQKAMTVEIIPAPRKA